DCGDNLRTRRRRSHARILQLGMFRCVGLCPSRRVQSERSRCAAETIMSKSTAVTIKDLSRHVLELCKKHGIVIYAWCRRPSHCHALIGRKEIRIMPIESRLSYASALHEIGHLREEHQCSDSTILREYWAWEWARANALLWTPAMENNARKAMEWYASHVDDRPDRLKRSAHHEAGHAVIARVLGILGGAATIAPNHIFQSYGGAESYLAKTMEYWRRPISKAGNKKLVLRNLPCGYRAKVIESMAGREAERECLGARSRRGDR